MSAYGLGAMFGAVMGAIPWWPVRVWVLVVLVLLMWGVGQLVLKLGEIVAEWWSTR